MKARCLFLALSLVPLCDAASAGEEDADRTGIVTLQVENDIVAGTDRHYSNGLRLTYLSPEVSPDHWARDITRRLPTHAPGQKLRFALGLGQSIFTPEDVFARELVDDDRPYAAWAYASFGVLVYEDERGDAGRPTGAGRMQSLSLDLGVVGPWALGEEVQNNFHTLFGVVESKGWPHQLRNEPGVLLTYDSKWRRLLFYGERDGYGLEVMPHVGGALGNVMTYAAAGASLRFGEDLPRDFGPPRIRPSLPGSGFFRPSEPFSWYLFAGVEGRYVLRNIFLDGNTFRESHDVDKQPLVADVQLGVAVTYGNLRLSYTHVYRSPEIEDRPGDRFGALALSWRVRL